MTTEREIEDAGSHLKRAARDLEQAAREENWEDARRHISSAAEEIRRAGNDLD